MSQQQLAESNVTAKQQIARSQLNSVAARPPQEGFHSAILQLQRTLGNQRVAQLIQAKRITPEGKIIGLQRKLTVGAADDQYEQEADHVARQVVSMPDSVAMAPLQQTSLVEGEASRAQTLRSKRLPLAASTAPFVQRHVGEDGWEPRPIQANSAGSRAHSFEAGDDIESQVNQSKGGGSQLPDSVRAYMEPRFGLDFSHVRVHTGSDAIQMNRGVGAQAFTHGSDIYYGAGTNPSNMELTAHELTHVVQQTGSAPLQTRRSGKKSSVNPISPLQRACATCSNSTSEEKGSYPVSSGQELIARQADEDTQQYPPDWQHGAPTKPVPPDPHVLPIPDPNQMPDQGPYRTPPTPQPSNDMPSTEPSTREKIAGALKKAGVPAWAVAGLIVVIIAALADPEPFTKVALLIGAAAATAFFILIGRVSDVPSSAATTASTSDAETGQKSAQVA